MSGRRVPKTGLGRSATAGLAGMVLLFCGIGGWAATAQIGGAVIASGQAVVRGKPQDVQHLDGGLVAEIAAAEGDLVAEGDVLVRLDATSLRLERDIARAQLGAALARTARLRAEEAGAAEIDFSYRDLPLELPDMAVPETDERRLFDARAASDAARATRLSETLSDLGARRAGTDRQIASLDDGIALAEDEIERTRRLVERGVLPQARIGELMRGRADMEQRREGLLTERARLAGESAAARATHHEALRALHEETVTARVAAAAEADALALRIVDLEARLDRVTLRAPRGGVVHDMRVTTTGGVVAPGDVLLQIVPQDRGVEFEIRIPPAQVDQVYPGQEAEVIVAAFDARATPRMIGHVARVSPGTVVDPRTGEDHFRAVLALSEDEIARLGEAVLIPGMPIEAYLKTADRTALSYLVEPLAHTLRRAMRE